MLYVRVLVPVKVHCRTGSLESSDKAAIIGQLETVLARLKAGYKAGQDHDDDFGYSFE